MNLLHALNKILQANRKLNEKKINEEEKLKMDNKNRERQKNLIGNII